MPPVVAPHVLVNVLLRPPPSRRSLLVRGSSLSERTTRDESGLLWHLLPVPCQQPAFRHDRLPLRRQPCRVTRPLRSRIQRHPEPIAARLGPPPAAHLPPPPCDPRRLQRHRLGSPRPHLSARITALAATPSHPLLPSELSHASKWDSTEMDVSELLTALVGPVLGQCVPASPSVPWRVAGIAPRSASRTGSPRATSPAMVTAPSPCADLVLKPRILAYS